MFTTAGKLFALTATAGLCCTTAFAQDQPLPRPPLQPTPKEFKVPRPNLGVPDGTPVAQESVPSRSFQTNPLPPERRYQTPPDINHETPRTVPQPPSIIGTQAAKEAEAATTAAELRVTGKVLRVDKDRVAVETSEGGVLVLYVDPKTRFLRREFDNGLAALVPGTAFTGMYARRGDRFWATVLDIVGANEGLPARPAVVVPAAANPYESEIVRVVGPDQIVVRNQAGLEFPVYVTGQTRYELAEAAAAFGDLRPGMRIRIDDELRAERRIVRRILGIDR